MTAYGFWLPNDPRGSWSDFVGAWELFRKGRATKVETRRSLAGRPHDRALRLEAKRSLKYPPVRFSGIQARAIGRGFAGFVRRCGLVVWACSILPEHVHLVLAPHRYPVEQVVNLLKGAASQQLVRERLHPMQARLTRAGGRPKAFARGLWKVFLRLPEDIERAIGYVERNPAREGLPPQRWSFVVPYDNEVPRRSRTRSPEFTRPGGARG